MNGPSWRASPLFVERVDRESRARRAEEAVSPSAGLFPGSTLRSHPVQRLRARTWSDKHKASLRCFLSFWSAATGPGGIKGAQAKLVGQYFGVPTPKLPGASLLLCLLVFVVFLQPFALLCLFVFTLAVCGDLDAASLDFLIPAHSQEDDTAVIRSTQLQS